MTTEKGQRVRHTERGGGRVTEREREIALEIAWQCWRLVGGHNYRRGV
eukprot:COSAG02_NODE_59850_length_273_cov_0.586207_1_plen_47_part_01